MMKVERLFRKMKPSSEVDLIDYISEYLCIHPEIDIMIGCDSQNYSDKTIYAIVVALYTKGKGAHILFRRWNTKKETISSTRLLNEVWYAIETAELIRLNGLPKPIWIDIDLNPDARYRSNTVFRQAVGMVEGMGYSARYKTMDPLITYAADHLIKA